MNKPVHVDELPFTETEAPQDIKAKISKPKVSLPLAQAGPSKPPEVDRFDWHADADCVILKEQPATAIYHGGGGHIVIRQTNGLEEDVTILITPENANRFMDGMAEYLRRK